MTQMTDAPETPFPPPSPPTTAPPLVRRKDDRVWLGVCSAIGRATGTDPVLWRVITVVLTLTGGSGLLAYLVAAALIRNEDEPTSLFDRLMQRRSFARAAVAVLAVVGLIALVVAVFDLGWDHGPGFVPVAVVGLLVWVVLRRRGEPGAVPVLPEVENEPGVVPPPRPAGPPVTLLTVSAALLVGAALVGLSAAGVDGLTAPRVSAAVLAVLGIGLVVGSRWGRQWTLISLTLLTFGVLNVTARLDIPFDASVGERTWVVTQAEEHRLGVGHAVLDLRGLAPLTDVAVKAELGVGQLEVLLPPGVRVEVHGEVGAGVIDLPGEPEAADGSDLELDRAYGPETGPVVRLDTRLGLGNLAVSGG
jgi:phage shock protein PspC (stress-responsive transcriptional regulator)